MINRMTVAQGVWNFQRGAEKGCTGAGNGGRPAYLYTSQVQITD